MILDDTVVQRTFGEAPKLLEWGLRIGLAAVIVLSGLILFRRSEPAKKSEMAR